MFGNMYKACFVRQIKCFNPNIDFDFSWSIHHIILCEELNFDLYDYVYSNNCQEHPAYANNIVCKVQAFITLSIWWKVSY